MASTSWTGAANNGLWSDPNNWNRSTGTPATIPQATDDVIIAIGAQDIYGYSTGVAFASITVTPGYSGTIGVDGVPIAFTNCTSTFKYAGNGAAARFAPSGTVASCELSHTLGMFYGSGAGTWTLVNNTYGNFDFSTAAIITALNNVGGEGTVNYNATVIATIKNSGKLTIKRSFTTWYADAGLSIHQDAGTNYTNGASIIVARGATYNKQSGGAETAIEVKPGGNLTLAKNAGGAASAVNLGTILRWAGSSVKTSAMPGVAVTVAYTPVGASAAAEAA